MCQITEVIGILKLQYKLAMLNSNFLDIRLSKRKNRFLFDYQILNIMVTSMHHYHCTQVPVSNKKRMRTTSYAEQIHIMC